MQISSIGAPLFSGALSGSNNSAANLIKKLSDKTSYLTDEKDFDDAIQKKIQLYQSDNTDSDLRKEGIDHKTGDSLSFMAGGYESLSISLKLEEQEVLQGTYGWREPDLWKNADSIPKNMQVTAADAQGTDEVLDNDTSVSVGEVSDPLEKPTEDDLMKKFQEGLKGIITVFTMGANDYKKSLENGYLSDGAQVTDSVTALIKQSLPDGNDDWLNVTAHSLGLDQTFDSAQDFANAIENASNVVKTYADAINTVTKTLPKEDWYDWNSWGTYLDTRA